MKFEKVRKILDAAMKDQQHGIIKFAGDSVDFDFTARDSSEPYVIGYCYDMGVVSVLDNVRKVYIECAAIQCIEVYG